MLKDAPLNGLAKESPSVESSIRNLQLVMQELKAMGAKGLSHLTAQQVYDNEDAMFELLSVIKGLFDHRGKENKEMNIEQANEVLADNYINQYETEEQSEKAEDSKSDEEQEVNQQNIMNIKTNDSVSERERPIETSRSNYKQRETLTRSHSHKSMRVQKQMCKILSEEEMKTAMVQGIMQEHIGFLGFPIPTPPLAGIFTPPMKIAVKKERHSPLSQVEHRPVQEAEIESQVPEAKKAPEMHIAKVSARTKHKLLVWLQDLRLIRQGATGVEDFAGYCRNGVLFADLISRVEGGRNFVLGGVARNPKSSTAILANLRICFRHLQNKEKINSRYLWAEKFVFEGNEDVIWGILDDIWHFYSGKLPHSMARNQLPSKFGH